MKFNSTLVTLLVLALCTVLAHGSLLAMVGVGLAGIGFAQAHLLGLLGHGHGHYHSHGHYYASPVYSYYAVPYAYKHYGHGYHHW